MPRRRNDPVDVLVGRNVRVFRKQRRFSQTALAKKIGVSFQQVQKYEKGSNRMGSGCLFKIAAVLKVPVSALFDGTDHPENLESTQGPSALLAEPYALRLLQAFNSLESAALRRSIATMVERMGSNEPPRRRR